MRLLIHININMYLCLKLQDLKDMQMSNPFKCILRIKSENTFTYVCLFMFVLHFYSLSSVVGLPVCDLFSLLREVTVLFKNCLKTQHVVKQYLLILIFQYSCYLLRL